MNDDALTTNPALNASRNFRAERQAEDSGEWHPVRPSFKYLPRSARLRGRVGRGHRAAAKVVAVAMTACLPWILWYTNTWMFVVSLPFAPVPGTLIALLMLNRFGEIRWFEAIKLSAFCSLLSIPGTFVLSLMALPLCSYSACEVRFLVLAMSVYWPACAAFAAVVTGWKLGWRT